MPQHMGTPGARGNLLDAAPARAHAGSTACCLPAPLLPTPVGPAGKQTTFAWSQVDGGLAGAAVSCWGTGGGTRDGVAPYMQQPGPVPRGQRQTHPCM